MSKNKQVRVTDVVWAFPSFYLLCKDTKTDVSYEIHFSGANIIEISAGILSIIFLVFLTLIFFESLL